MQVKHLLVDSYDQTRVHHVALVPVLHLAVGANHHLLHSFAGDVCHIVGETPSANKNLEPLLLLRGLLVELVELISLHHVEIAMESSFVLPRLHHLLFGPSVASMIQERHWLSESDVKAQFSVELLLELDVANSLTDVVEIRGRVDYVFYEVGPLEEVVTRSLLPKVEDVVLEKLHVSHEARILLFDLTKLFLHNLGLCLLRLLENEVENFHSEFDIFNRFLAHVLVLFNPLRKFGDERRLNVSFELKLFKIVHVFSRYKDVRSVEFGRAVNTHNVVRLSLSFFIENFLSHFVLKLMVLTVGVVVLLRNK